MGKPIYTSELSPNTTRFQSINSKLYLYTIKSVDPERDLVSVDNLYTMKTELLPLSKVETKLEEILDSLEFPEEAYPPTILDLLKDDVSMFSVLESERNILWIERYTIEFEI